MDHVQLNSPPPEMSGGSISPLLYSVFSFPVLFDKCEALLGHSSLRWSIMKIWIENPRLLVIMMMLGLLHPQFIAATIRRN